jgi:hypothetical protein
MKITLFVSNKSLLVTQQMSYFRRIADVEIVNIDDSPDRAQQDGIIVTPSVIVEANGQRQHFNFFDRTALRDYIKYYVQRAAA